MLAVLFLNLMSRTKRPTNTRKLINAEKKKRDVVRCRTCLSSEDLESIFFDKETEEERSNDLHSVTGVLIRMNDGLSQKICTRCVEIVNSALQFRRACKNAELTLLNACGAGKQKVVTPLKKRKLQELDEEYGDDFQNNSFEDIFDMETKPKKIKKVVVSKPHNLTVSKAPVKISSFSCSKCDKRYTSLKSFKTHVRLHNYTAICEACGLYCRTNNRLESHQRAKHGLVKIQCAHCDYSASTQEAIRVHERRHTGERPYVCDHCGASFHRRANLVQHIAIHLPDKKFQCSYCSKWEKSKKRLSIHISQRHREKKYRYKCPMCVKTYQKCDHARRHLVRVHGVPRACQGPIDKQPIEYTFLPPPINILNL